MSGIALQFTNMWICLFNYHLTLTRLGDISMDQVSKWADIGLNCGVMLIQHQSIIYSNLIITLSDINYNTYTTVTTNVEQVYRSAVPEVCIKGRDK